MDNTFLPHKERHTILIDLLYVVTAIIVAFALQANVRLHSVHLPFLHNAPRCWTVCMA